MAAMLVIPHPARAPFRCEIVWNGRLVLFEGGSTPLSSEQPKQIGQQNMIVPIGCPIAEAFTASLVRRSASGSQRSLISSAALS